MSRTRTQQMQFDPAFSAAQYTASELESFIRSAGNDIESQYLNAVSDERERLFRQAGIMSPAARQEYARSGEFRRAMQQFRHDYVRNLYNRGLLMPIAVVRQQYVAPVVTASSMAYNIIRRIVDLERTGDTSMLQEISNMLDV